MGLDLVIGAGVGGLAAAAALARAGRDVVVVEARGHTGGLAGGLTLGGRRFDGGPYILLDRPGLSWVFERLGTSLEAHVELIELDEVYRVRFPDRPSVSIFADLDRTADGLEASWPGSGRRYRAWVRKMARTYERLRPLQTSPRPGPLSLLQRGLLREVPFLLRGLEHHVRSTGLAEPVVQALGIWTHIAGQSLGEAPAPLAFVPAIVHTHGAYTAVGGVARVPEALEALAREAGVRFELGRRVRRILRSGRRVRGVEIDDEVLEADRVFCNASGVGTYVELLDPPDTGLSRRLQQLPLQSPGVAAYLDVDADPAVPFLQFWLPGDGARLLVCPGAADATRAGNARLVSPMAHVRAQALGLEGQNAYLDWMLAETWWQEGVTLRGVLERRVPVEWGAKYLLYRDSMNPVMTARFMRQGRLPHRSPVADNLFLMGSATHPGQWVSFCAISGLLAVDEAMSR